MRPTLITPSLGRGRAVFLAHDDFCRRTPDVVEGRTRLPAAMAAGATAGVMSFEQPFDAVMCDGDAMAA